MKTILTHIICDKYIPSHKCIFGIDDIAFGTIVGGIGGSLIGGLLGSGAQSSANSTNLQIAQMNNEFNERMLEKQIAYNRENQSVQNQWSEDMYRKYNSPQAQVAQMAASGINPYTQGASTIGANMTSANAGAINPASAAPVSVQAETAMADAIKNMSSMLFGAAANASQVKGQNIDNEAKQIDVDFKVAQYKAQLAKMAAETDNYKLKNEFQKTANQFQLASFDADLQNKFLQNRLQEHNIAIAAAEATSAVVRANFAKPQMEADLKRTYADIFAKTASGRLTLNQASHELQKLALTKVEVKHRDEFLYYGKLKLAEEAKQVGYLNENLEKYGTTDAPTEHTAGHDWNLGFNFSGDSKKGINGGLQGNFSSKSQSKRKGRYFSSEYDFNR